MARPNRSDKVHGSETEPSAGSPAGHSRWTAESAGLEDPVSVEALPAAFDKRDPYHLLKLFGEFSAASVIVILLLVG